MGMVTTLGITEIWEAVALDIILFEHWGASLHLVNIFRLWTAKKIDELQNKYFFISASALL